MPTNLSWHCPWCDEYYDGPYQESIIKEREHRASCLFRPSETQLPAAPGGARPPSPRKGTVIVRVTHGTNCTAAGQCSRSHCWHDGQYRGELCAWPVSKDIDAPWQACPNLSNPTIHEITS